MQHYINQLLNDIDYATNNVSVPFIEKPLELSDWMSEEEEEKTAPVRNLQEWTGIFQEMLPAPDRLSDSQVHALSIALRKMLEAYNCYFVLQCEVPERVQYAALRDNINQEVKIKQWHVGFFALCKPGTGHKKCALGEFCQCALFASLFADCNTEELSPEEERASELQIEIKHLKRKYGDDWRKYYPYHLDKNFDDENGQLYKYGLDEEDEPDDDDWWRR